jgi:hypothetical protein
LDCLLGARVEEQPSQQAEAKKRKRRPARLQAKQDKEAAAKFGQIDQRQQPAVDAIRLHTIGDAAIARYLPKPSTMKIQASITRASRPSGPDQRERKLRLESNVPSLAGDVAVLTSYIASATFFFSRRKPRALLRSLGWNS